MMRNRKPRPIRLTIAVLICSLPLMMGQYGEGSGCLPSTDPPAPTCQVSGACNQVIYADEREVMPYISGGHRSATLGIPSARPDCPIDIKITVTNTSGYVMSSGVEVFTVVSVYCGSGFEYPTTWQVDLGSNASALSNFFSEEFVDECFCGDWERTSFGSLLTPAHWSVRVDLDDEVAKGSVRAEIEAWYVPYETSNDHDFDCVPIQLTNSSNQFVRVRLEPSWGATTMQEDLWPGDTRGGDGQTVIYRGSYTIYFETKTGGTLYSPKKVFVGCDPVALVIEEQGGSRLDGFVPLDCP